jgi:cytochrome c oxidase cbb3-type subunit 2
MRAALAVAAVYGYFLIFAQFSFVELLRVHDIAVGMEKILLGVMALAGIGGGFVAAWRGVSPVLARIALTAAAFAAGLAPYVSGVPGFMVIALATGASLGVATVCLSALLPAWCGIGWVGLGTGIGYAVCNLPAVFLQGADMQAWIGAVFALIGVFAMPGTAKWNREELPIQMVDMGGGQIARATWPGHSARSLQTKVSGNDTPGAKRVSEPSVFPVWAMLAIFTALVWMDSAAFFVIQHAGDLKSGTWGAAMLWRNATVHLVFALAAGWWLAKGGARFLPATAWVLLAVAALAVNAAATRPVAGWFYPAGVSLYSTALVAWPGWFSGANDTRSASWRAAWLFAIAGWFGSANGIGMAETLHHVPPMFVAGAGLLVVAVMILSDKRHWRATLAVAGVVLAFGFGCDRSPPALSSAAERGRRVYVSEGCIHCHSQYVRPGSADEEIWGPPRDVESTLQGKPVLIGNRRQGPDLTNVGARRSEPWLREHFIDPRALVPGSPMPSYAHLFDDGRGEDLVRYLKESGVGATAAVMARAAAWKPGAAAGGDGRALFASHCATCHGDGGHGDGILSGKFPRPPANLVDGPFVWTACGENLETRIARIIKFGITGTNMPGHEVMSDKQVNALVREVLRLRTHSGMPERRSK